MISYFKYGSVITGMIHPGKEGAPIMTKKKKTARKHLLLFLILVTIIFILFIWEERKDYEVLHSTVISSANLTETKLTIVIHSFLPVNEEKLADEIVSQHQRLNGEHTNPYYKLELYRTDIHYRLHILYDTLLCNRNGQIVTEITF